MTATDEPQHFKSAARWSTAPGFDRAAALSTYSDGAAGGSIAEMLALTLVQDDNVGKSREVVATSALYDCPDRLSVLAADVARGCNFGPIASDDRDATMLCPGMSTRKRKQASSAVTYK